MSEDRNLNVNIDEMKTIFLETKDGETLIYRDGVKYIIGVDGESDLTINYNSKTKKSKMVTRYTPDYVVDD